MTAKSSLVPLTLQISEERISDLLCCAFEGGSNYWYNIADFKKPDGTPEEWAFLSYTDEVFKHLDYPMNNGGSVIIEDTEDDNKSYVLDRDAVMRGLQTFATLPDGKGGHHFANWLAEKDDAETGDVFLQCCLFNEIRYG